VGCEDLSPSRIQQRRTRYLFPAVRLAEVPAAGAADALSGFPGGNEPT
jgi:hypothetical protein